MRKTALFVLLFGVLAAGFVGGVWYSQRERVDAADLGARRVLHYVDPMHPAYTSATPGVAPDCGMALEPVYADSAPQAHEARTAASPGAVFVTPETQRLIGVRTEPVRVVAQTETLRLYGRVAPDETRLYKVNIGIDGFVHELSPLTTGSDVRKDEWLATFGAPEARSPIQGYLIALEVFERTRKGAESAASIGAADAGLQQAADRLMTLGMSSVQVEEIRRTRQVPTHLRITAPAAGIVASRSVSPGQRLERGDELFTIADLRRVWILADVFGPEAEYIRPGMVAQVSSPARRGTFAASVSRAVQPQFDAATQTVKVRFEADNPGNVLRPGMFVDVGLPVTLPPGIAVPVDAVLDAGLKKSVFVERAEGVFEPREVQTGWRFGDRVQIVGGLDAGERIVVAGTFLLDSESKLRHFSATSGTRP